MKEPSKKAVAAALATVAPNDVLYGDTSKPISEEEMKAALLAAYSADEKREIMKEYKPTRSEYLMMAKRHLEILEKLQPGHYKGAERILEKIRLALDTYEEMLQGSPRWNTKLEQQSDEAAEEQFQRQTIKEASCPY